jgi:hypothetical protein
MAGAGTERACFGALERPRGRGRSAASGVATSGPTIANGALPASGSSCCCTARPDATAASARSANARNSSRCSAELCASAARTGAGRARWLRSCARPRQPGWSAVAAPSGQSWSNYLTAAYSSASHVLAKAIVWAFASMSDRYESRNSGSWSVAAMRMMRSRATRIAARACSTRSLA